MLIRGGVHGIFDWKRDDLGRQKIECLIWLVAVVYVRVVSGRMTLRVVAVQWRQSVSRWLRPHSIIGTTKIATSLHGPIRPPTRCIRRGWPGIKATAAAGEASAAAALLVVMVLGGLLKQQAVVTSVNCLKRVSNAESNRKRDEHYWTVNRKGWGWDGVVNEEGDSKVNIFRQVVLPPGSLNGTDAFRRVLWVIFII